MPDPPAYAGGTDLIPVSKTSRRNDVFELNCSADMDEEQGQFIAEAREMVERLDRDLEQLRVVRSHGRQRRELAARIFRRVHTLKGSAGSFGLRTLTKIPHDLENALGGVRRWRGEKTHAALGAVAGAAHAIPRPVHST